MLVLIVLAVLAGGCWLLFSSRTAREEGARRFAREAATRLFFQQDARFLNQTLTPRAQLVYPPSWRERFFAFVRELGPAKPEFELEGDVTFTSEFFDPRGVFSAHFEVASGPAVLFLTFSHPGVRWEIDDLKLSWTPPATPTPAPTATPLPSPTVTPAASPQATAAPKRRRK